MVNHTFDALTAAPYEKLGCFINKQMNMSSAISYCQEHGMKLYEFVRDKSPVIFPNGNISTKGSFISYVIIPKNFICGTSKHFCVKKRT